MTKELVSIIRFLGEWSYVIIFLIIFFEGAAFMGFFFPGETIAVLSGFLSSRNYLKLTDCIVIIVVAAILGDTVGFVIGKAFGRDFIKRHRKFIFFTEERIDKAHAYFMRHGGITVFIGRFISFLREMAPFTAGLSGMKYRRFLLYNVAGGICWALVYIFLGYFFGRSLNYVDRLAARVGLIPLVVILLTLGLVFLCRKMRKKRAGR